MNHDRRIETITSGYVRWSKRLLSNQTSIAKSELKKVILNQSSTGMILIEVRDSLDNGRENLSQKSILSMLDGEVIDNLDS